MVYKINLASIQYHYLKTIISYFLLLAIFSQSAFAVDYDRCREFYKTGQYQEAQEMAKEAVDSGVSGTQWRMMLIKTMIALGRYDKAAWEMDLARLRYPSDIPLLELAYNTYKIDGQSDKALEMIATIYTLASSRNLQTMTSLELVSLGKALLVLGGEPKLILEQFYNLAMRNDPNCKEAYFAAAELAMQKQDFQLASRQYNNVIDRFGDDPDAYYGLAAAFYNDDRKSMIASLDKVFAINPNHAPAIILLAEHQIDSENYESAERLLKKVFDVNPWYPNAWAYRAVLDTLANDSKAVETSRNNALKYWSQNPEVDYLIGRKLSQKYRFKEGAEYQYSALKLDPEYMPSKIQLAEDMLRLGDDLGWEMVEQVQKDDPYNVKAYNLATLHDNMSQFETLKAQGLKVRMNKNEAAVYGDEVIELLKKAKVELCEKYGTEIEGTVTIELFDNQQDFAVRTFGVPGGDGFLGVCFGKVITANSPKLERPSNWKSTLWHEFCHVVTLGMTDNKMPRWLSEGLSVYEESQRDPTCGQHMNPQYLRMILNGELTPISELSAAFLNPSSTEHLLFAYYESSLVVEFIVENYGYKVIKAILADLKNGKEINSTIAKHTTSISKLENQFEEFVMAKVESITKNTDWDEPDEYQQSDFSDIEVIENWLEKHPNSYWALSLQANYFISERQFEKAKEPLQKMISIYPEYAEEDNPYRLLASVHQQLSETEKEQQVLREFAARSSDAVDAYSRLMDIAIEQENWQQIIENGNRFNAVYPMLGNIYQRLGLAYEKLDQKENAVQSYQHLLLLDPADPVDINYRLANLLKDSDPDRAKKYLLESLSDAPRFRDGHELLLEIMDNPDESTSSDTNSQTISINTRGNI